MINHGLLLSRQVLTHPSMEVAACFGALVLNILIEVGEASILQVRTYSEMALTSGHRR